jgi:2-polyprenyl-3-methyl-5-hydroxy-6-metoxy-1,4-benzoquinol methylase
MSERKKDFSKKKGIEVGCGLGLPAILGAKIGAQMTATDFHPDVGAWVATNAELNGVRIDYRHWDWTAEPPTDLGTYDFVLASDVLYESRHPEDLARALARLVTPQGSIYLSDPGRGYLNQALEAIEQLGFNKAHFGYDVEESSHRPEVRLEQTRRIWVYEFTRSQNSPEWRARGR